MLYKAKVPMIVKAEYVKKGDEFEATPEDMAHYDQEDFSPVDTTPVAPPEPELDVPIEEMNQKQLQAKAKELGLSGSGSKADLLERITLHLATPAEENAEDITNYDNL
jgi:hypothetical protein